MNVLNNNRLLNFCTKMHLSVILGHLEPDVDGICMKTKFFNDFHAAKQSKIAA